MEPIPASRQNRWPASLILAVALGWLAAVGCATHNPRPLVIQPPAKRQPEPAVPSEEIRLSVLTFNILGLPRWLCGVSSKRFLRIAGELERLQPDFVLLQEVWTHRAQEAVPTSGEWWMAAPSGSGSFFRRSGLVTLSRHRVVGGEFFPFAKARLPDALVNKGVLKTTIELASGARVNLWNVHLQSGKSDAIRSRQIAELIRWVCAAEDGQVADLVAGDFNATPDSAPYQQLCAQIGLGGLELSHTAPFITYDGLSTKPGEAQSLDHVFIRPRRALAHLSANPHATFTLSHTKERLSDHLGVVVELGFAVSPALIVAAAPSFLAVHSNDDPDWLIPMVSPESELP